MLSYIIFVYISWIVERDNIEDFFYDEKNNLFPKRTLKKTCLFQDFNMRWLMHSLYLHIIILSLAGMDNIASTSE